MRDSEILKQLKSLCLSYLRDTMRKVSIQLSLMQCDDSAPFAAHFGCHGCLLHHRRPCYLYDSIPGCWLGVETSPAVNGPPSHWWVRPIPSPCDWICRFLPPSSEMAGSDRDAISRKKANLVSRIQDCLRFTFHILQESFETVSS